MVLVSVFVHALLFSFLNTFMEVYVEKCNRCEKVAKNTRKANKRSLSKDLMQHQCHKECLTVFQQIQANSGRRSDRTQKFYKMETSTKKNKKTHTERKR